MTAKKLYYTREETARLLRVSVSTLDRWRREGKGPTPSVFGPRSVRYLAADILMFQKRNRGAR